MRGSRKAAAKTTKRALLPSAVHQFPSTKLQVARQKAACGLALHQQRQEHIESLRRESIGLRHELFERIKSYDLRNLYRVSAAIRGLHQLREEIPHGNTSDAILIRDEICSRIESYDLENLRTVANVLEILAQWREKYY